MCCLYFSDGQDRQKIGQEIKEMLLISTEYIESSKKMSVYCIVHSTLLEEKKELSNYS